MHFTKIKLAGIKVELHWTTEKGGSEVKHEMTSYEQAAPEFVTAMKAFIPPVLKLLELPADYAEGFIVSGLSINYEDSGRRGLVVTCMRKLADTSAPLVLNTPHLREEQEGDQGGKFLPDLFLRLLDAAEEQANAFVEGRRAQGELFGGTKKTDESPTAAPEPMAFGAAADTTATVSINGGPELPFNTPAEQETAADSIVRNIFSGRDRAAGRDA